MSPLKHVALLLFLFFLLCVGETAAQMCQGFAVGTTATSTGISTNESAFYETYGLDFGNGITAAAYCLDFDETGPGVSGVTFEVVASIPVSNDGLTPSESDLINCFDEANITDVCKCIWSHTNDEFSGLDPGSSNPNNITSILVLEPTSGSWQPLLVASDSIYGVTQSFCGPCTSSTSISPWVRSDGGSWSNVATLTVCEGSSIDLGTQAGLQSDVVLTKPDASTDNTADGDTYFRITSSATTSDAGTYTITYTDSEGCTSQQSYTVTVNSNPTITPYINVDGGGWSNTSSATIQQGEAFELGTQSGIQSSIVLTYPDGSTDNSTDGNSYFTMTNSAGFEDRGTYVITYTDGNGCIDVQNYTIDYDLDQDEVADADDFDDDNDGILDTDEGYAFSAIDFSTVSFTNQSVGPENISVDGTLVSDAGGTEEGNSSGDLKLGDGDTFDAADASGGDQYRLDFGTASKVLVGPHASISGQFNNDQGGSTGGDQWRFVATGGFTVRDPSGELSISYIDANTLEVAPTGLWNAGEGSWSILSNNEVSTITLYADGDPFTMVNISINCCGDTDRDGIADHLDLDSDADGIADLIEAGGTDSDGDGQVDYGTSGDPSTMTDADNDGLLDAVDDQDSGSGGGEVTSGTALADPDSDSDGLENRIDIDSDADGITDNNEAQTTSGYTAPTGSDTDGDGIDNAYDGDDNTTTGIGGGAGTAISPTNTDEEADLPDYLDTDSDEDGESDTIEAYDTDDDGIVDTGPAGADADGDGLDDNFDSNDLSSAASSNPNDNGETPGAFRDTDIVGGEPNWREPTAGGAPAPIELLSFSVYSLSNGTVKIRWQTLTETHNDFFTLERSRDAESWEELAYVKGAGDSQETRSYQEIDRQPFLETSYYRLKQTDYNGEYSYSQIMEIYVDPGRVMPLSVYPIPTKGELTIEGAPDELSSFSLFDITGKDVTKKVKLLDRDDFRINLTIKKLPRGIYLLKTASETVKVEKE